MLPAYKYTEFVQTNKWSYLRAWLKLLEEKKGSFLSRLCVVRVLLSSTLRWPLIWYSYDWRNMRLPPFWFYSCTCADVWPLCGLRRRRRRRRRAYAPTSNPAGHDNPKINSWVSFSLLYEYGAPLGGPSGRRSSAINGMCSNQWRNL